jgi:hypothetical protein
VLEHVPHKSEALSLNPRITKINKQKRFIVADMDFNSHLIASTLAIAHVGHSILPFPLCMFISAKRQP